LGNITISFKVCAPILFSGGPAHMIKSDFLS
jgi:hypothetical protein